MTEIDKDAVEETSMKLFRMRTLTMFGIGFLAGSAAGRGPWEKAQQSMDQIKGKVSETMNGSGSQMGSTSSNGSDAQRTGQQTQSNAQHNTPQMTG